MSAACSPKMMLWFSLALAPGLLAQVPPQPPRHLRRGRHREPHQPAAASESFDYGRATKRLFQWYLLGSPWQSGGRGTYPSGALGPTNPNAPPAANAYDWTLVDEAASPRRRRGIRAKSSAASEDHPDHRDRGLSIASMDVGSDSQLRRTVSVARADPSSSTCGTVIFMGWHRGSRRQCVSLAVEPLHKSAWRTFLMAFKPRAMGRTPRSSRLRSTAPLPHRPRFVFLAPLAMTTRITRRPSSLAALSRRITCGFNCSRFTTLAWQRTRRRIRRSSMSGTRRSQDMFGEASSGADPGRHVGRQNALFRQQHSTGSPQASAGIAPLLQHDLRHRDNDSVPLRGTLHR